jgi:hypothetical protein
MTQPHGFPEISAPSDFRKRPVLAEVARIASSVDSGEPTIDQEDIPELLASQAPK